MKNVSFIEDCYGCGVCSISCPKHIISIQLSTDGFYKPVISKAKDSCIECGICIEVCAFNKSNPCKADDEFGVESYASWSNDDMTRQTCSSGGISYELGKEAIRCGHVVCAVKYNTETQRAEHYIATCEQTLEDSKGSKYIQSYTIPGFSILNKKDKYMVVGTPCQIDSLRRYTRKFKCENNYVLVDFYCHGTPSMLLWKKYLQTHVSTGVRLVEVAWRNKDYGWHDSWAMTLKGENFYHSSRLSKGDLFYKYFLENRCLNKACYNQCKYKKEQSAADIRLGDLWGNEFQHDDQGVSALLVLSLKGKSWLNRLDRVTTKQQPLSIVQEGQMITSPPNQRKRRSFNLFLLKSSLSLKRIHTIDRYLDCLEYYKNRLGELLK